MGHAERAVLRLHEEGLGVADRIAAGGRVAGVANHVMAGELGHPFRNEDVPDEPEVLMDPSSLTVGHGHAGAFLAAVLERVEGEERDSGRFVDAGSRRQGGGKDAALVLGVIESVEGVGAHCRIPLARRLASMRGTIGSAPATKVCPVSRS